MSQFSKDEMGSCRSCLRRIGFCAMILGMVSSPSARGSSIHQHAIHASSVPRDLQAWLNFLAGGESLWSSVHAPPITANVRHFMAEELSSTDPTGTPMVTYLEWRRDLDPTRFDHYHPRMGPELQNLLPTTATSTPPPTNPSPQAIGPIANPSPGPGPESGGGPVPPAIPEPSTLTLALALIGVGSWWRHRTGRALADRPLIALPRGRRDG